MNKGEKNSILNIPNQLTMARLVLSLVFFVVLTIFNQGGFGEANHTFTLNFAMAGFILAVSTDFLDGYLARKWGLVSTFGRIADPFVDKIIICGSFIFLVELSDFIHAWYAVVILFRELLISGLRSFLESQNIPFPASMSGKIKMISQCIAIPCVIFYEANFSPISTAFFTDVKWVEQTIRYLTHTALGVTLLTTVTSCISYVSRAFSVLRSDGTDENPKDS